MLIYFTRFGIESKLQFEINLYDINIIHIDTHAHNAHCTQTHNECKNKRHFEMAETECFASKFEIVNAIAVDAAAAAAFGSNWAQKLLTFPIGGWVA